MNNYLGFTEQLCSAERKDHAPADTGHSGNKTEGDD